MVKKKTYVLDTTVLIYDPDIFYKLGDADIVIPLTAIKELDGLKNSSSELVAQAARKVSRTIDRISSYSDMTEVGGDVSSGARIFIENNYEKVEGLESEGDRKIIGTALYLKKKGIENLLLATTDTNMRIVGRTYGLKAEHMPDYFVERDSVMEMDINMNSSVKNSKIATNNTFTKTVKTILGLIFTILVSIIIVLVATRDIVAGLFFGFVMGGMIFMTAYAVYLRKITKHIPYSGKRVFYERGEESSKMLSDSPPFNVYYGSHPYYGSDKQQ